MPEESLASLTVQILREIREELRALRADQKDLKLEVRELRADLGREVGDLRSDFSREMSELRAETRRGFMLLDTRFENLKETAGAEDRVIKARVDVLENQVHHLQIIVDRLAVLADQHKS